MSKQTPKDQKPSKENEVVEAEAVEVEAVEAEAVETDAVDAEVSREEAAEAAAARAAANKNKQILLGIPNYQNEIQKRDEAKAAGDKQAESDSQLVIDAIDEKISEIDLDDLGALGDYGASAFDELNAISDQIIKEQKASGVFSSDMANIAKDMADMNFDSVGNAIQKVKDAGMSFVPKNAAEVKAAGAGAVAGGAAGSIIPFVGTAIGAFTGAAAGVFGMRKKQARVQQETLEQSEDFLIASLSGIDTKSGELIKKVEEARNRVRPALKQIEVLGKRQVQAYTNLSLYISAGKEVLRMMEEDYIPAAQKRFEQSEGNLIAQDDLESLQTKYKALNQRIDDLHDEHASSFIAINIMSDQKKFYVHINGMLTNILRQGTLQWKRMQIQAGTTIEQTKTAKVIEEAKDFSGMVMRQNAKLHQVNSERMHDISKRGLIDPDAMLESIGILKGIADKAHTDVEEIGARRAKIEAAVEGLAQSMKNASTREMKQLLGYTPTTKNLQIEDSSKKSKDPFNRNADGEATKSAKKKDEQAVPGKPKGLGL